MKWATAWPRADSSLFESTQAEEKRRAIEAAQDIGASWGSRWTHRAPPNLGLASNANRTRNLGHLPPAVVADVFHGARPRAAVLHRAVFGARIRQLYARRRDAADLREIWNSPAYRDFRSSFCPTSRRRPARIAGCDGAYSLVIPTFHKAETIALVVGEIPGPALPS